MNFTQLLPLDPGHGPLQAMDPEAMKFPTTFPAERDRALLTACYSCVIFAAIRFAAEKITPVFWPGFNKLTPIHHRDWSMRCTSTVHSVFISYHAYHCLVDPVLYQNRLTGVSDGHYFTAAVSLGYFVYDTIMVFTDIEAEREAGGLLQTILHHAFVLAIMPVGLVYNTMVWYGSGVYFFWGEITGFNMNMIWLMRTAGFEKYVIYVVNGLVFSFAFITIRTIVLGYYMYMFYLDIAAHPEFCQNTIPTVEAGACQMAVGLLTAVYLVGLSWVPAVVSKVIRAINRFLDSDSVSSSDEEDDAHTKAAKAAKKRESAAGPNHANMMMFSPRAVRMRKDGGSSFDDAKRD